MLTAGALSVVLVAAFVRYEARRASPLLDVRLFTNPRFSAASIAIAAAFFGLFGFIFLITQYLQLVLGYSPLEAGVRTVPFAVVTGAFSPVSIALMHRLGTKAVVAAGLALMSIGFVIASQLQADSAYVGPVLVSMVVIAAGLGLTTSPATEAIMGALPAAKAGVGSAVNDTTRELGGTLGVALVGSVFASLYAPQIVDALRGSPAAVVEAAGVLSRGGGRRRRRGARRCRRPRRGAGRVHEAASPPGHWSPQPRRRSGAVLRLRLPARACRGRDRGDGGAPRPALTDFPTGSGHIGARCPMCPFPVGI